VTTTESRPAQVPDPSELLFAHTAADAPQQGYKTLREQCPVAHSDFAGMPATYISRYEDVLWALRHPEVFSSDSEALSIGQEQPLIPLQVDPPLHTIYRRILNPEFIPKKVAEMHDDVVVLVNGIIDRFADRGSCDFHEEFATPLPSAIFLRLMGLPQSDLPIFLQWRDNVIRPDVAPGDFEGAMRIRKRTGHEISEYFTTALAARRQQPDDGFLSQLVRLQMDGRLLTHQELLGICQLLILGGLDTVTATLDCMITYLARHDDERRRLVENPDLIPSAVEELLRTETPVMLVPRVVHQAVTIGGVELSPGDHISLVLGAANGDDAEFPDADTVDLARDANRHLAFGGGHHLCLGMHLARLELRVGLEAFHRRIPDYAIADGAEIHFSPGIRQADRLPLVFSPAT
jgi:cytochrome P450